MDLKIFKQGEFTEETFNKFCKENIIYKYNIIEDVSIYIFYKQTDKLGQSTIETVELLDRLVKQTDSEIIKSLIDKNTELVALDEINKKLEQPIEDKKEHDKLVNEQKNKELQVKMYDDTILQRTKEKESIILYSISLK